MYKNNLLLRLVSAVLLFAPWTVEVAYGGVVVAVNQGNQVLSFDSATPSTTSAPVNITGLADGDVLSGIDGRPSNGLLYGFSVNGTVGRLYTINPFSGLATNVSTISSSIVGTSFGVDFNPVVDRLRLVSDAGQNLRINVDTGAATVDSVLNFATGDANEGVTPSVVAAAYTNTTGAASTTLYDIDSATQSLLTQNPPNSGTLNTIGTLGGIAFPETSFDIDGLTNMGYIVNNGFELSTINLSDGSFDFIGSINTNSNIIGIATNIAAVPEPSTCVTLVAACCGYLVRRRLRKPARPSL